MKTMKGYISKTRVLKMSKTLSISLTLEFQSQNKVISKSIFMF